MGHRRKHYMRMYVTKELPIFGYSLSRTVPGWLEVDIDSWAD